MSSKRFRTMDELALACGVSRPTLSKYFDDPESVRAATRRKIEAALEGSEYRPNLFARNLNRKQTRHIGVIVPHITDPFYAALVRKVELRCLDTGFWPIVISSHGSPTLEARAVDTLLSLKVAGALVAPLGAETDIKMLASLQDDIPLVFFDSRIDGQGPFVGTDNRQSIALLVEYLCRTGEHPTYFEMPPVNRNASERREAYIAIMEQRGLEPIVVGQAQDTSWEFEEIGFIEMQRILDARSLPTRTILCANDRIAFGVMSAAFSRGLKVGRDEDCDLRVAGHDDHPLSRYTCPPLTTVAQDIDAIAIRSTDILFASLRDGTDQSPGEPTVRTTLVGQLVMRQSA
ncbi:LacI family DNA-binding transcriptional regulator [Consotaella aegiceratis]|uniref:LacI family DNA-binding transcriptional regulator n=1 Tax=Consotaella aegiceratis TaxID=3097961 RepID=UPI002F40F2BD